MDEDDSPRFAQVKPGDSEEDIVFGSEHELVLWISEVFVPYLLRLGGIGLAPSVTVRHWRRVCLGKLGRHLRRCTDGFARA